MVDQNNEEVVSFDVNFAEALGYEVREIEAFAVVRPLKMDGYYQAKIVEAKPGKSAKGNGKFSLRLEIEDEDETGSALYAEVPATGASHDGKRTNIQSLVAVLLSTGRTTEELDRRIKSGEILKSDIIAKSLTTPGKNICFVQVKHAIQTMGKNSGKERADVSNFVPRATYDSFKAKNRIRWAKKLETGETSMSAAGFGGNGMSAIPDADVSAVLDALR